MANFKEMPQPPSQVILFPVSLEEALPKACDVRLLSEAIDALDFQEFEAGYADTGCPAYPPRVLCKILIYGYCKGMRSSRALEEAVKNDRRYLWLAGGLTPDHCTLARFRKERADWLKSIYQSTVRLCAEAGLVLLQATATDGSKIRARASRRSLYDAKRLAKEAAAIERILEEAEATDRAEDAVLGERATDILPAPLAKAAKRKQKLTQIAAQLQESGRKNISATEPDARVMKTTQGLRPAYNTQVTVDTSCGVIVAAEVIPEETDHGQLSGQLEQVTENVGCCPDVALADTGYSDERTFQALTESGQEALIPPQEHPRETSDDPFASKCFQCDQHKDVLICPAGRELTFRRVVKCSTSHYRVYTARRSCRDCSHFAACVHSNKKASRSVWVRVVAGPREHMRQRLKTPEGQALYRLRSQTVERVIARLKVGLGLSRFGLAGLEGARAEWWLVCAAHNLLTYLSQGGTVATQAAGHFLRLLIKPIRGSLQWIFSARSISPKFFNDSEQLKKVLQQPASYRTPCWPFSVCPLGRISLGWSLVRQKAGRVSCPFVMKRVTLTRAEFPF